MPILLPGERPPRIGARAEEIMTELNELAKAIVLKTGHDDIAFITNTSADGDTSSFFVQREPHQVRAAAHTGVSYEALRPDEPYVLTLSEATRLPEYERNSLHVNTGHHLCEACLDVFNYYCEYVNARWTA